MPRQDDDDMETNGPITNGRVTSHDDEHLQLLIPSGTAGGEGGPSSAKLRGTKIASPKPGMSSVPKKRKQLRLKREETAIATFIKYAALVMLVAQMVGLVLLMRYSRTQIEGENHPMYLASTAVFFMEVMKLSICLLVMAVQERGEFVTQLRFHICQSPQEMLKLCVPSLLYTVQNNLLYLALTNLDAATYQVCYQFKILTTALFSALLLNRRFSAKKWFALIVLTLGVVIVQISGSEDQHSSEHLRNGDKDTWEQEHHREHVHRLASEDATHDIHSNNARFIGFVAVLCAACTSGFSGVYFEKILKGSTTSLWVRNIQMGIPSIMVAYITIVLKDRAIIRERGFLQGYNNLVWLVVTVQAVGGLIVAVVVKFADNVLKVFATSFSIVVSCILSAFLFDFHPSRSFLVGASLVVTATVMYSSPEKPSKRKSTLPLSRV